MTVVSKQKEQPKSATKGDFFSYIFVFVSSRRHGLQMANEADAASLLNEADAASLNKLRQLKNTENVRKKNCNLRTLSRSWVRLSCQNRH